MSKVNVKTISKELAIEIFNNLKGCPAEDRVLIFHQNDEEKTTNSGIILPGQAKEGIAKKGVIVSVGMLSDSYTPGFRNLIQVGNKVIFGDYAGKVIEPEFIPGYTRDIPGKFSVLSISEIIYIEL